MCTVVASGISATSKTVANYSKSLPVKSVTTSSANINQSPALLRLSQQTQKFLNKSKTSSVGKTSNSLLISEDSTIVSEGSESIGVGGNKFLKSKQAAARPKLEALESPTRDLKTAVPGELFELLMSKRVCKTLFGAISK